MKSLKGSKFEREVCKLLSKWWTRGKRDDVFWRVSQSGGRATQRAKKGMRTYGSYGDVAAVDPIGEPLLKAFTIELKRGKSHGCPSDLIDRPPSDVLCPFEKCLMQAVRCHRQAGSMGWMLILRRDFKRAVVYADASVLTSIPYNKGLFKAPCVRFNVRVGDERLRFAAIPLDSFLQRVTADQISSVA